MSQSARQEHRHLLARLSRIDARDLVGQVDVNYGRYPASGSFARAFAGVWQSKHVCVKVLHSVDVMDNSKFYDFSRRLVRELMIWRTLHHPNVVELHGWILELDEADKLTASFISTWCEGGDVKRYLQRNPDADRCRIICSAAEGVAYLHLRGIVHGDITPRNVVIDRDGLAKLCDFGVSSILNDESTYAEGSSVVRSLRFIAPELLNVDDPVVHRDERSDVWAFGCTSAEILSDRPPYHGIHEFHVPSEIAGGTPPYIWDRPDEVGEVIVRCMTFQRDSRPGMLDVTRSFRRLGLVTGGSTLARSTCGMLPSGGARNALPPRISSTRIGTDNMQRNREPDILGHIPHDAYTIYTLEKFCMGLQRSSLARGAHIISLKRHGGKIGVPHRFLILRVQQIHGHSGDEFYIRLDRRHDKKIPLWKFMFNGGVSDAMDSASFSRNVEYLCDCAPEEEALMTFPAPVPLIMFTKLLEVIVRELKTYSFSKENCWFFTSIIQECFIILFDGRFEHGELNNPGLGMSRRAQVRDKLYLQFPERAPRYQGSW